MVMGDAIQGDCNLKAVVVLMSSYNGEKYIQEQIDSILAQKGDFTLDLCVRDDGSRDKTQTILQDYKEQGKLRWYTGNNLKPAHSFMDLLQNCKGYDYYAFADQDDYWMPDKLARAIRNIENFNKNSQSVLYFSNAVLVDAILNDLGRNVYKEIPKTDFYTMSCAGGLIGCTMVFNDALAKLIHEKPVPKKMIMHDFYTAIVCSACGGEVLYDDKPSMKYRQHGNNVVGISYTLLGKAKFGIDGISRKASVSIAEQAREVLDRYESEMTVEQQLWLKKVSVYRKNILTKLYMSASRKVKYINWKIGLKNRMSILLGNR